MVSDHLSKTFVCTPFSWRHGIDRSGAASSVRPTLNLGPWPPPRSSSAPVSTQRPGPRRGRPPVFRAILPRLLAVTLYGTATAQTGDTLVAGVIQDAYLDETARHLMLGAKAARDTSRLTIDSYTTVIRERIGIEVPGFRRDRAWSNGERAVRVRWSRTEPNVVHVLGSRLWRPGLAPGESEFFQGLGAERFAADPLWDPFVLGASAYSGTEDAAANIRSPCAVERRTFLAGANPARQRSLQPVAARAVHGGNDMD